MNIERSVVLVFVMTLLISALSVVQWNQTVFVCQLLQGILALGILVVLTFEIIIAVRSKDNQVKHQKARNLVLFLIIILIIPLTSYLVRTDGGKKIKVRAEASGTPAHINLYLFTDNSFKLWHSGPVAGTYYRGSYNMQHDTLRLDNDRLIYLFPTLELVLRKQEKYLESITHEDSTSTTQVYKLHMLKGEL